MADDKIGDWSIQQLVRFLEQRIQQNPPSKIPNLTCDNIAVTTKIQFYDQLQFNLNQTTVGAAGSASALPANPTGYFQVLDNGGNPVVIPYYKAS